MSSFQINARIVSALMAATALGFASSTLISQFHSPALVHAESHGGQADGALDLQLSGISPTSALTVYSPAEHKLYVYPAVTQGSSTVNCSFTLRVTRLGGPAAGHAAGRPD